MPTSPFLSGSHRSTTISQQSPSPSATGPHPCNGILNRGAHDFTTAGEDEVWSRKPSAPMSCVTRMEVRGVSAFDDGTVTLGSPWELLLKSISLHSDQCWLYFEDEPDGEVLGDAGGGREVVEVGGRGHGDREARWKRWGGGVMGAAGHMQGRERRPWDARWMRG